jgi:hypothetical protein
VLPQWRFWLAVFGRLPDQIRHSFAVSPPALPEKIPPRRNPLGNFRP